MSHISVMRSPTFLVIFLLICCINVIQAQQIPNEAISAIITALKAKGFNTVALVLPYLIKFLVAPITLLIPTDQAIAGERIQESQLVQIAQFHMVKNNFSFTDFQLLPVNTYLPTLLLLGGVPARVEVRNNSADNYTLNNARIVEKDICPSSVASFVTCQGISQILQTPLSEAPAPTPMIAPIAPSPMPALVTPLQVTSLPPASSGLLPITTPSPTGSSRVSNGAYSMHVQESVKFLTTMCISIGAFMVLIARQL
ncbi:hypothetical protein L7F22_061768 [Adiantum nelumboides]|nr:hypothetical protein [Adiantum nelumboides]